MLLFKASDRVGVAERNAHADQAAEERAEEKSGTTIVIDKSTADKRK